MSTESVYGAIVVPVELDSNLDIPWPRSPASELAAWTDGSIETWSESHGVSWSWTLLPRPLPSSPIVADAKPISVVLLIDFRKSDHPDRMALSLAYGDDGYLVIVYDVSSEQPPSTVWTEGIRLAREQRVGLCERMLMLMG